MECSRCGGLLVPDYCYDPFDNTGQLGFSARRCVACGDVIDPGILDNRRIRGTTSSRSTMQPPVGKIL